MGVCGPIRDREALAGGGIGDREGVCAIDDELTLIDSGALVERGW